MFHGALRQFLTNLVGQHSLGAIYKLELSSKRPNGMTRDYIVWIIAHILD